MLAGHISFGSPREAPSLGLALMLFQSRSLVHPVTRDQLSSVRRLWFMNGVTAIWRLHECSRCTLAPHEHVYLGFVDGRTRECRRDVVPFTRVVVDRINFSRRSSKVVDVLQSAFAHPYRVQIYGT